MKKAGYLTIGKIGATHGVHGWLKIHSYTEFDASIFDYPTWYLTSGDNHWNTVTVEDSRRQGKSLLVKLEGFNTPEEARVLTGKLIAIERTKLPALKKDEYYWTDLEGLTVINKDGQVLGRVDYLIETGSNDVLVVKGETEQAIPYLPGKTIILVDLENQEIHVDWEPL